mgnify:FL=1
MAIRLLSNETIDGNLTFGAVNPFSQSANVLDGTGTDGARIRSAVSAAGTPTFSNSDDTDTGMFFPSADSVAFSTGGTTALTINSSQNATFAGDINIAAAKKLKFNANSFMTPENNTSGAEISTAGTFIVKTGSTPTLGLTLDASQNATFVGTINTGKDKFLRFIAGASGSDASILFGDSAGTGGSLTFQRNSDAASILTLNGNKDATFGGNIVMGGNQIKFADNGKLMIGDSNDLQIYHNGSNSIIDNNTNDLIIRCDSDDIKILSEDDIVLRDNDDSTNFIHCINGGAVKLYHNGSEKFDTTSGGARTTGTHIISDAGSPMLEIDDTTANKGELLIFRAEGTAADTTFYQSKGITGPTGSETYGAHVFQISDSVNPLTSFTLKADRNAAFEGNVGIGPQSGGALTQKLQVSSVTNADGIIITGDGTTISSGDYRRIGFRYDDTDESFESEIRFVVTDENAHGGQMQFVTDNSSGTKSIAMTIDKNQRVGIGTTNPLSPSKLQIEGGDFWLNRNNAPTNIYLRINKRAGQDGGILLYGNSALDWQILNASGTRDLNFYSYGVSSVVAMIQNSTGRVGIGTTSPSAQLHLFNSAASGQPMLQVMSHATAAGSFTNNYMAEFCHAFSGVNHGMLVKNNETDNARRTLDIADGNGIFATFTNGKLGIGTTNPTKQLHLLRTTGDVRGIMVETSVATSYAEVQVKAASEFRIGTGGSSTTPNGQFYVYDATAGAHRFDIDANGNVGIGQINPSYKLEVNGTANIVSHLTAHCLGVGTSAPFANGVIRAAGDIIAYYSSDKNLKDNITKIEKPLEKLEKINGYEFDWNDKQELYEGHDVGVVAQEIEEVYPQLVETREDGYKAVKYEKLVPLLIESIKELKKEIDNIKTRSWQSDY